MTTLKTVVDFDKDQIRELAEMIDSVRSYSLKGYWNWCDGRLLPEWVQLI